MDNDIGASVAAAVQGHIKALRLLGRVRTTAGDVASALGLPENFVMRAMADYKIGGAKLTTKTVARVGPLSREIELRKITSRR